MCENKELKRHKWADVLIAIAEGREVQYRYIDDRDWKDIVISPLEMNFSSRNYQWRVKPKTVRKYLYAYKIRGLAPTVTIYFYKNDFDYMESMSSNSLEWFQRLDNSCVEVEE